jgi:6-pyruvoyltetrahydropterin/6-carboxytetrahydropterin synthase
VSGEVATMRVELSKEFSFEAAHRLPRVPPGHKCARLHGHSFRVEVKVEGEVDPETGWLVDYGVIAAAFSDLKEMLDHRYLNEVAGLENPTSEAIAAWIWERLAARVPGLSEVLVRETCTTSCRYRGPGGFAPPRGASEGPS